MTEHCLLHHEISGSGPPLVILHGLFGNSDNFRSIALHMERHFQIIRFDLPGHGKSDSLSELTLEAMAEAVLQNLPGIVNEPYALLGHSLGGKVAMAMAGQVTTPSIKQLIVVDIAPRVYPPHHGSIFDALSSLPLSEIKSRSEADTFLREAIPDAGIRGFLLKSLARNADKQLHWEFDLSTLMDSYSSIRQIPQIEQTIEIPTLFIKGGDSDYLLASDEPAIRTHFSSPQLKAISGAGHWPHAEKPGLFTRICLDFLE